jgi:hypothetical protein
MAKEYFERVVIPPSASLEGEAIFFEDFEGNFNWSIRTADDSNSYKAPEAAYRGEYGCVLETRAVGAATYDWALISRYVFFATAPVIEMFFYVKPVIGSTNLKLGFDCNGGYLGGKEYWNIGFYLDNSTKQIYLLDETGFYVYVTTLDVPLYAVYTYIELSIDLVNRKYKYLRIGDQVIDLSAYRLNSNPGTKHWILPRINILTLANAQVKAYVDNIGIRPSS